MWTSGLYSLSSADWTLSVSSLRIPSIPINKLNNPITSKTILLNPTLFQIITPINVDCFESFLVTHPSQPFIKSVCKGLREGFWPWADTFIEGFFDMHNESRSGVRRIEKTVFLQFQIQIEQEKHHFSSSFGNVLLPGMYSMSIHVVLKPGSLDLHMVTDRSFGSFSLNSMIPHNNISGYFLDNIKHLGEILLNLPQAIKPPKPSIVFESDVAEAYRLLPVHKKWQIKQINTIDGQRYVDCCRAFGNHASGFHSILLSHGSHITSKVLTIYWCMLTIHSRSLKPPQ
jgi:hypothetical protein